MSDNWLRNAIPHKEKKGNAMDSQRPSDRKPAITFIS